jgi:hypothetical protein
MHNFVGKTGMRIFALRAMSSLVFCLIAGSLHAEAACMSCISQTGSSYTELACEGDSKFDVIRKCGKPDYEEESGSVSSGAFGSTREKGMKQGGFNSSTERIEKVYFNCGRGRFINILTFRGGTLITIETGDRGSGDQKCW